MREAELAVALGYDAALLSLAALSDADNERCSITAARVADIIPVVGFYLQPAVGGRVARSRRSGAASSTSSASSRSRSRRSIAIARSTSLAAVAESGRADVALYTGNDDADRGGPADAVPVERTGRAVAIRRRAARPMGGLDETRGRIAGRCRPSRMAAARLPESCAPAGARRRADGRQRRVVRSRARFRRMHSRHPRGAAPPGAARRPVVPRSARGAESRARWRRSIACSPATRT